MVLDKLWETGICAYNIMWDQNCNDIDQNIMLISYVISWAFIKII